MVSLDNMPVLVLDIIMEFLDYGSRRTCRLICRRLKEHVDDVGLSVKIDSRSEYSTALSQSVVTTEVRIIHLESYDLKANAVRSWKTAILSTPLDFSWLNDHIFLHCSNLRVLILNEAAIIAEEFSGTSDPIPCLSRLSELQITLTERGYKRGITKLYSACLKSGVDLDEINDFLKNVPTRLQNNISFLLKIINSRVLKVLWISVPGRGKLEDGWAYQPLYEFLEKHRNSLETIILLLELDGPSMELHPALMNPIQLKGIRLSETGGLNPSNHRVNSISKYWTNQLLHQGSLENLSIQIQQLEEEITPFPWLADVVFNNARTLTYINLAICFHDELNYDAFQGTLDMRLFRDAESVRVFNFKGSHRMRILNLNDLPTKSLKFLKLSSIQIGADFDGIKFMECFSPVCFYLRGIAFEEESRFKDPRYTFQFIKLVLRCRSLEDLDFYSAEITDSFPKSTVSESRLEHWVTQLEADEHLPNMVEFYTMLWIFHGTKSEWVSSYDITNYLELVDADNLYDIYEREPPFYLPRNLDTFSVWTDSAEDKTATKYCVLPNTQFYPIPTNDGMKLFKFHLSVLLNRNSTAGMKVLGLTEETLANEKGVTLMFEPEDLSASGPPDQL